MGSHTVCAIMTASFLEFSKSCGNDLSTPLPEFGFPGLKPGDRWCLCAPRWQEALEANRHPASSCVRLTRALWLTARSVISNVSPWTWREDWSRQVHMEQRTAPAVVPRGMKLFRGYPASAARGRAYRLASSTARVSVRNIPVKGSGASVAREVVTSFFASCSE